VRRYRPEWPVAVVVALAMTAAPDAFAQHHAPKGGPAGAPRAPAAGRPARVAPALPREAPPSLPEADVKLTIDAHATQGVWTMQVTSAEDTPVQIVADARLLSLDVTPRGARRAVHCELPADMRAEDDLSRNLVLPPGGKYVEDFDPRLYCFGAKAAALEPQAVVVAHLGWAGRRTAPPFVVSAADSGGPVGPARSIDSLPVGLPDEATATPPDAPSAPQSPTGAAPRLVLRSAEWVDATTPDDATVPVTLSNESNHAVVVRFSPETLSFDVSGPRKLDACPWPTPIGAPVREAFTTLPAHGQTRLDLVLRDYCTGRSLDRTGLLAVRVRLDTRKASGADVGLQTFDGVVEAARPTLIRLHRGAAGEVRPKPVAQVP
jgi:hypothetical protein